MAVPDPKTLPVLFVLCVNIAPELKVIPLASAATNWFTVEATELEKVMLPVILPVAPVNTLMINTVDPLIFSWLPLARDKSVPVPPEIDKVVAAAADCRFTMVLPLTES